MNSLAIKPKSVPVRVGAVSYLNSKPLIATLDRRLDPEAKLTLDLPSRLATQLFEDELDVGLIPAIEFFRHPTLVQDQGLPPDETRIISNACIACRGIVRSVRLLFRIRPENVRTIAVDEGSRTSVALALVLMNERFGIRPDLVPLPITSDPNEAVSDAVLVIGDRAMHPKLFRGFVANWDLGLEWYEETGLPFVFAMWVGRQSIASEILAQQFENARDDGIQLIENLSEQFASQYGLSKAECIEYLAFNLRYTIGADEIKGLKVFYQKASILRLIPNSVQPNWSPVSSTSRTQLAPHTSI